MKNRWSIIPRKVAGVLTVIVLIVLISIKGFQDISKVEEKKCFSTLSESAETISNDITLLMNKNIKFLKILADDMVNEGTVNEPKIITEHINVIQYMSIFDRIDVLYPDNSILLQNGEMINSSNILSFEEISKKGEHISNRSEDIVDKQSYVINCFVPIEQDGEKLAIIVGVIKCEDFFETIKINIYNGSAHICMYDFSDNSLIMDSWKNNLISINDKKINEMKRKLNSSDMLKNIEAKKAGTLTYISENNIETFMYYMPVGIGEWELLIMVQEDIVFESSIKIKKIMNVIITIEIIIFIVYLIKSFIRNTRVEKKKDEVEKQLTLAHTLVDCITLLSKTDDIEDAINELLKIISEYFEADRAYIFEIDYINEVVNNTYEYAKEGVSKEIDNLQNVPLDSIAIWLEEFKKSGQFSISSLDKDVDKNSNTYEILAQQNIDALVAVPLIENDVIIGFAGIDNPTKNYDTAALISSTTYFIMDTINKRRTQALLERLSYEDALTGMYNRNKFNHDIEEYQDKEVRSLGFGYFDLNGLKEMNDKYGHKAGDLLIKRVSKCLSETFGEKTYRIGGDEFVVIIMNIAEHEFLENINNVIELLDKKGVSVAVGTSWRGENNDVLQQMHEADRKMYKNKKQYYEGLREI